MKTIFEYLDYKKYINDYIKSQPRRGYGLKQTFANAASCQMGYISQVLNGDNHFSGEQVEAIGRLIGLNSEELEYLLLLIHKERAGTSYLKNFYLTILSEKQNTYSNLKNRMKIKESLTIEDQAFYYSKWYIGAIHMLITIPQFKTVDQISKYFNLPLKKVREALDFLTSRSILKLNKNEYTVAGPFLHLAKDSPLLTTHHTNWRIQAVKSMANEKEFDLHFSSCFTISEEDLKKLRSKISNYIEEISEVIKPSKEEKMYCFNVDYFEV